jgi:hypothetical protein
MSGGAKERAQGMENIKTLKINKQKHMGWSRTVKTFGKFLLSWWRQQKNLSQAETIKAQREGDRMISRIWKKNNNRKIVKAFEAL